MIRFTLLTVFLLAGILTVSAQTTPGIIKINQKMQPGLILQLPNNTTASEGTILQKLSETGYKPETKGALLWKRNKTDGFYVFNGVQLPALDNQKLDLYFKVEPKSRSQKDQSTIYMLVSKGYDNFVSLETDTATFAAATAFLNGFVEGTAVYSLNRDIEEQEKMVQKAEKRLSELQDDSRDIARKIESLQADQRNKANDEEMQKKEIATQKAKLEELRTRTARN